MAVNRPPLSSEERTAIVARLAANPVNQRLTDEQIEAIHSIGLTFYGQGRYEDAFPMFVVSSRFRPAEPRFLMTLGVCHQAMKNFAAALEAFELVVAIEPGHGDGRLQAARCLVSLGEVAQARALLTELSQSPSAGVPAKKAASLLRMLAH